MNTAPTIVLVFPLEGEPYFDTTSSDRADWQRIAHTLTPEWADVLQRALETAAPERCEQLRRALDD